jgi:Fe-S cluster assembly ATP-binding protein
MLEIKNLFVSVEGKEILKGINLKLQKGKVYALMGPNGSGKTTLANVLMGHPKYVIKKGQILFNGKDITKMSADKRAKLGIFLSFQYPKEIPGVPITSFLRTAYNSVKSGKLSILEFQKLIEEKAKLLSVSDSLLSRYLNEGFSGGEKKRTEILQMAVLDPKFAIMDETDSGLDIDSLRIVSNGVNKIMNQDKTILLITHYKRILEYIHPDEVIIMLSGKVITQGKPDLIDKLEKEGYGWLSQE